MKSNFLTAHFWVILIGFIGLVLTILGGVGNYIATRKEPIPFIFGYEVSIVLLSIGCSLLAAVLIEIFSALFHQKEFKKDLIENLGSIYKASDEWGLINILPSNWTGFYDEIKKSNEVRYLAFNSRSIFSPIDDHRKVIVDFLAAGGKLTLLILGRDSLAFQVRKNDWGERSQIFESEMDQVNNSLLRAICELAESKPNKDFRLIIRCIDKFIYSNLVIFDKRLYHYSPNSNTWKGENGFSFQARPGSKLAEHFENLFIQNLRNSKPYEIKLKQNNKVDEINITIKNLKNYINLFTKDNLTENKI